MEIATLATTAVSFLSPYLVKAGEKTAEKIVAQVPASVGKVWQAITAKFHGKPAAEEAVKDLIAKPADADNQAAFRKELRKVFESESAFATELQQLLGDAQRQTGETISNTGSGAVATQGSVAAGAGGIAIGGNVQGNVSTNAPEKDVHAASALRGDVHATSQSAEHAYPA